MLSEPYFVVLQNMLLVFKMNYEFNHSGIQRCSEITKLGEMSAQRKYI